MSLLHSIDNLRHRSFDQASMTAVAEILKELYLRQVRLDRKIRDLASKQDTQAIELDPGASASSATRRRNEDAGVGPCPHFGDASSQLACRARGGFCSYAKGIDCGMCHTRIRHRGNS